MPEDPTAPPPPEDLETSAVYDFIELFLADRAAGRHFDLPHYLRRFPGAEAAVAREFVRLEAAVRAGPSSGGPTSRRVGPYELLRELGRGGQAVAYLARDTRLGREVALKVLRAPAGLFSASRRRRFRREAAVLARLDHPGICPVFETDLEGDPPYIAMRHVRGATLARLIALARSAGESPRTDDESDARAATLAALPQDRLAIAQVLRLIERAARALHSAHEVGIIHRDIKPGNIMVTPEGDPVLLDFGLARGEEDETQPVTLPGEVFGTLHYMAPEELRPPPTRVDRRADVYALGVTLFECLTLERLFSAPTREGLVRLIEEAPPPEPRKLNPALPPELSLVLHTALEKNPERRYPTALALAEDLRRVREYEPIRARPVSRLVRLSRWARRRPGRAVAAALLTLIVSIGAVLAALWIHATRQANLRYRSLLLSTLVRDRLARERPVFALLAALHASAAGRTEVNNNALLAALKACRVRALLSGVNPTASPDGRYLATHLERTAFVYTAADGRLARRIAVPAPITALVFAPRAPARLLIVSADGEARLLELPGGRLEHLRPGGVPLGGAFDPAGRRVAFASARGGASLWDVATGRRLRTFPTAGAVSNVLFSPTGRFLLTYARLRGRLPWPARDRMFRLWEVETGRLVASLSAEGGRDNRAAFQPGGGGRLALAVGTRILLWDPHKASLRTLIHPAPLQCLAFSPDGRYLAAGDTRGLRIWSLADGGMRLLAGHDFRRVATAVFHPDGRLLTAGSDGTARIWDVTRGRLCQRFKHAAWYPRGALWLPGRAEIATSFGRRATYVWALADRPGLLVLRGHTGPVRSARFGPQGARIVTASMDGTARIWDARTGRTLRVLSGHTGPVLWACFSSDGRRVLTASADRTARIWEAASGRERVCLSGHRAAVRGAAFGPQGAVLTWSEDGTARIWDGVRGRLRRVLAHRAPVNCAAWSPRGRWVVTGDRRLTVRLWEVRRGGPPRVLARLKPGSDLRNENVFAVTFSPDGRYLAVGAEPAELRVFTTSTWRERRIARTGTPGCLAFDPAGGRLLVGAKWRPTGRVVDLVTSRAGPPLRPSFGGAVSACAWGPRGRFLVLASLDGTARLWKGGDLRPWLHLTGHTGPVHSAAFSPDGTQVVTASEDGTARLWPVDPLRLARARKPRELTAAERAVLAHPEEAFLQGVALPVGREAQLGGSR